MRLEVQSLRRGAALLLLAGHLGAASVRSWRAVDWEAFVRPREDRLSVLERTHRPLREALKAHERVGHVVLGADDERWNTESRFQLQYLLAPTLLDPVRRDQVMQLIEQRCEPRRCTPGPELAPGRARAFEPGLLLLEQAAP
jgi:hypothetical protein